MSSSRYLRSISSAWCALAILVASTMVAAPVAAASGNIGIEELGRQQLEESLAQGLGGEPQASVGGLENTSAAMTTFACLPSCTADDGRFLAIASGASLATLSEAELDIQIGVPSGSASFVVGFFDGDADSANGNWDVGNAPFEYTLFADPDRDGLNTTVVAGPFVSSALPNNGWFDTTVATSAAAQAPSGNYFYRLNIVNLNSAATVLNSFKVRSTGVSTLEVDQQPFGFYAALQSQADANIIFPIFPDTSMTTYDGVFSFYLDVESADTELLIWGGDLDRGSFDGTSLDTDDPDTPNAPFVPAWSTVDTVPEGVATGLPGTTGNPADDTDPSGAGVFLQRTPAIFFEIVDPNGVVYLNDNPSGNQEWEQFRLTTDPVDPLPSDFLATDLPVGVYEVRASGVDMQNLNFWRFFDPVLCLDELGVPCMPLRSYVIGDEVWIDTDGSGTFDPGESGVGNVVLELYDANGFVETTTTDAGGLYEFQVNSGTYTVEVASSNFDPGGPLAGLVSTTGGEAITDTVTTANIPTYDFGYVGGGSIGNYVWLDVNDDGINNEPATAGIGGVIINLTEAGPDMAFGTPDDVLYPSETTDPAGAYDFTQLPPGNYRVDVDESTLPPSFLVLTTGNEPLDYVLGSSEDYDDADFGYKGPNGLGDVVWQDNNGDGIRQLGEPGIGGVELSLYNSAGDLVATTTTSGFGTYQFTGLPDGSYRVEVNTATLPAGLTPTFDRDGVGTPHVAANIELQAGDEFGQFDSTVDFGYQQANGAIGDRVWNDLNGDGIEDVGEPGISGVTVTLRDSGGAVLATDVTDGNGNYSFTGLGAATYTVDVDSTTLPAGLVPTFDFDGIATPHTATVPLGAGETNNGVDFGYTTPNNAALGDRVWLDANGDGVQDIGEAGINGVTVNLLDGGGATLATQITAGDGNYGFNGLPAGTYTVEVDASTLPGTLAQTYDLDGLATPHQATVTLGVGEARNDVDFGYAECGACDGKVTRLTFQYQGDQAAQVVIDAKRGPSTDEVFNATLQPGEVFEIVGPQTGNGGFIGTLGTEIKIYVDGALHVKIHTSCSQPIGPGLIAGDFKVLAGASRNGGILCPLGDGDPGPGGGGDECSACDGKVTQLRMRYNGDTDGVQVQVVQKKGGNVVFSGTLNSGDEFDFVGQDKKGTLGTEIQIFVGGVLHTSIHTSCSKPIGPGLVSGDFEVVSGASRNGGSLCPIDGTPGGGGCGECAGKITRLSMRYNGSQNGVAVTVVQKKDGATVFTGTLDSGDEFEFVGRDKKGTLSTEIKIYVDGALHASIHTSCSQPVGPGFVAGDFEVISGESRSGGNLCAADGGSGAGECGACAGKVTELRMRYNGSLNGVLVEVVQKKPSATVFSLVLNAGEELQFSGVDDKGTLSTEIKIYVDGALHATIHTSCSQAIDPGQSFGDFEVISGASLTGGSFCAPGGTSSAAWWTPEQGESFAMSDWQAQQ